MQRLVLCAVILIFAPMTAQAERPAKVAERFSKIIVGEKFCDVPLNITAVIATMREQVDANDLDFNEWLEVYVSSASEEAGEMGPTQKALHCAQVRRNAEHYGWVKAE